MKIIQVHNYYQQAGGEDGVVEAERALLTAKGSIVVPYYKTNDDIGTSSNKLIAISQLLKASVKTLWNRETYREFRKLLKAEKPDVVHCHNTFPLISPSIYWACAKEGIPVVQTLHNYRLLCLNAFLFRQGRTIADSHQPPAHSPKPKAQRPVSSPSGSICELCVSKSFKWPGIRYSCYRDNKAGSLVVALMLFIHKLIGTWSKKVTAYIALTEFQKQKMIEGGLPAGKIFVKPNFIQTTEVGGQTTEVSDQESAVSNQQSGFETQPSDIRSLISGQTPFALFVGRLSPEKGCDVLIRAWARYQQSDDRRQMSDNNNKKPQLLIVGDGPERSSLEQRSSDLRPPTSVHFLGQQPKESVLSLMRNAQFLVLPSLWYEGFPMTIVESYCCGTPVVAADDGGMREVILNCESGMHFEMGNAGDLCEKIKYLFDSPDESLRMGAVAKNLFNTKYSAEVNYQRTMEIYESVR